MSLLHHCKKPVFSEKMANSFQKQNQQAVSKIFNIRKLGNIPEILSTCEEIKYEDPYARHLRIYILKVLINLKID